MSENMNKNPFETQPLEENANAAPQEMESSQQLNQVKQLSDHIDDQVLSPTGKDLARQQQFNENLIKLLVLLYQIDNKITLTEQDYFEDLIKKLDWNSGVSISAFINDTIHQARVAIDHGEEREFLFSLAKGLNHDPAEAYEHAMNLTAVDGNRSDEELEILSLLSNRVLTKGLVA